MKSSKKYVYRRKSKDENFFFLSRKIFKMEQKKTKKNLVQLVEKNERVRGKNLQKTIFGKIKNKNNILSDQQRKSLKMHRERERREGDLLGLDLNSNLLLGFRRSRLL